MLGLAACAAGLAGTAALCGLIWTGRELRRPHAGWPGPAAEVLLEPGQSAESMLDELAEAGVLRRPALVRVWLLWAGGADRLQAGEYRFDAPASAVEVVRRLRAGDVVLHEVTLPEGLTLAETARRLAEAGFGPDDALRSAFANTAWIRDLDADAPDLEGYLYPETYHFARGERPERIAEAMTLQFRQAVGPEFAGQARASGLTVRQAVTLASMIELETSLPQERPRVSAVFHNRLARGMRLECDPTVDYALARAGREVERLTFEHLRFESPFNTYVIQGLPAGPIANPGRVSLLAAVAPLESDELYFVAAPTGGHRFSRDLAAHHRAVAEWRRYVRSSR